MQTILDNDLQNTTLVGHSLAGVWMQLLLQQIPERIGMMIFIDAVALEPGESFFSNQIAGLVPTYPVYPSQACSRIRPVSHPATDQRWEVRLDISCAEAQPHLSTIPGLVNIIDGPLRRSAALHFNYADALPQG